MAFDPPNEVRQRVFNLDEISRRADPDWPKDRNYMPAYKFSRRKFVDHRDNVYQVDDMLPDEDGRP